MLSFAQDRYRIGLGGFGPTGCWKISVGVFVGLVDCWFVHGAMATERVDHARTTEFGNRTTEFGNHTGSYLRLIDFVYHSTLGLRGIKKKNKVND